MITQQIALCMYFETDCATVSFRIKLNLKNCQSFSMISGTLWAVILCGPDQSLTDAYESCSASIFCVLVMPAFAGILNSASVSGVWDYVLEVLC